MAIFAKAVDGYANTKQTVRSGLTFTSIPIYRFSNPHRCLANDGLRDVHVCTPCRRMMIRREELPTSNNW